MRIAALLIACLLVSCAVAVAGDYPVPSPYPIAWQFDFKHGTPKRIAVEVPGEDGPQAYYYMTYTVTNKTGQERMFYPNFLLLTRTGELVRSDKGISPQVFAAIKQREGNKLLERSVQISGEILIGDDQARDGVAIWKEPMAEMGRFSIFVGGLSGEHVALKDDKGQPVKDADGNPVILRKTLQLNYVVYGDDIFPGRDEVNKESEQWIMR